MLKKLWNIPCYNQVSDVNIPCYNMSSRKTSYTMECHQANLKLPVPKQNHERIFTVYIWRQKKKNVDFYWKLVWTDQQV